MHLLEAILSDPLKRAMLALLLALEIPAAIFLVREWIRARKQHFRP